MVFRPAVVSGFGFLVALLLMTQATADPPNREVVDAAVCLADVDIPLQVELEAPLTVSPGVAVDAVCQVVSGRTAERIDLAIHPSAGVSLHGPTVRAREAVGAGREASFDLRATLEPGQARGTVDVLVTAWIDGLPYERGVTWNLASELPATGRVVARDRGLSVRELPVGRASR